VIGKTVDRFAVTDDEMIKQVDVHE